MPSSKVLRESSRLRSPFSRLVTNFSRVCRDSSKFNAFFLLAKVAAPFVCIKNKRNARLVRRFRGMQTLPKRERAVNAQIMLFTADNLLNAGR